MGWIWIVIMVTINRDICDWRYIPILYLTLICHSCLRSSADTNTYSFTKSTSSSTFDIVPEASYSFPSLLHCLWSCASNHTSRYIAHNTITKTCTCVSSVTATSSAPRPSGEELYFTSGCDPQTGFTAYTDGNITMCLLIGGKMNYTAAQAFCLDHGSRMVMPDTKCVLYWFALLL